MITQIITDSLGGLKADTMTVAGLAFASFFVIHLFSKLREATGSRSRIKKQVQRMVERDAARRQYMQQAHKQTTAYNKNQPVKSNRNYSKTKKSGYQSYLKQNASKINSKQVKKHNVYKQIAKSNSVDRQIAAELKRRGIKLYRSVKNPTQETKNRNSGKFNVKFIGDLPLNRPAVNPRYTGPTNSFVSK